MIDLHCHLLWSMDDGADSMEDTIALCHSAVENGIRIIAATPHLLDVEMTDDFLYERNRRITELNTYLQAEKLPLRVCGGAELYLNDHIFTADALEEVTLNRSKYLLCEYSLHPFDPEKVILYAEEILERGLVPLIAHPERYPTFQKYPEIALQLRKMGARFQVNADSLAGKLGEQTQDFAEKLLLSGIADVIATDAHDPHRRHNRFLQIQEQFPKKIPADLVKWATWEAPQYILRNAELPVRPREAHKS